MNPPAPRGMLIVQSCVPALTGVQASRRLSFSSANEILNRAADVVSTDTASVPPLPSQTFEGIPWTAFLFELLLPVNVHHASIITTPSTANAARFRISCICPPVSLGDIVEAGHGKHKKSGPYKKPESKRR